MNPYHYLAQYISQQPDKHITFAEYMNLALYDPQIGYYSLKSDAIGGTGDFLTSSHLCQDFGELLAKQFVEMWIILGQPSPFTLVEMGAGHGLLAADILNYLQIYHPELFKTLHYLIIEKTPILQSLQQQRLVSFTSGKQVQWVDWDAIAENSIVGCCFSNELVDAFPVHQVVAKDQKLWEVYVALKRNPGSAHFDETDKIALIEVLGEPSSSELVHYFTTFGIDLTVDPYPDGYRTEVNLAALDWLKCVGDCLKHGYLLTIDYGYKADRYYHPSRHVGTLQCYYNHAHHNNPYLNLGQQDITAHVNFTALEKYGEAFGLDVLGFTQQGLFLMALGLGDRLQKLSTDSTNIEIIQHTLKKRDALHQLINPLGLGNFGVLVQTKGLTAQAKEKSLQGFNIPDLATLP